jgi:hypothetical protein
MSSREGWQVTAQIRNTEGETSHGRHIAGTFVCDIAALSATGVIPITARKQLATPQSMLEARPIPAIPTRVFWPKQSLFQKKRRLALRRRER